MFVKVKRKVKQIKLLIMLENKYSAPQIYGKTIEDEWFIGFKFFCATRQREKRTQVRLGINYLQTVKERQKEAENVLKLVLSCLEQGWNPFYCTPKKFLQEKHTALLAAKAKEAKKQDDDPRNYGFNEALEWAYKKKDCKAITLKPLRSTKKYAKLAAQALGVDKIPIREIDRFHVCEILDKMKEIRQEEYDKSTNKLYRGKKITPNYYNNHLAQLSNLLFEYDNRGIIPYNPCSKIVKKPPIDFGTHRHPTAKELAIIKEKLPSMHQGLYDFVRFEFVTGMRPDEIVDTRFDMVDHLNSVINLSEDMYNEKGETISKTSQYRLVPVPQFLLDWIVQRQKGREATDYIFSRKLKAGAYRITAAWVGTLWRILVKETLGINISLYAFKGMGGDAKRDAGIELPGVSIGYGHSSTVMAQRNYLEKEGERLRLQVIEKAPDL